MYYLHGLIFGLVTRKYGTFEVTTFVGRLPLNHMMNTGEIPQACNDNVSVAA